MEGVSLIDVAEEDDLLIATAASDGLPSLPSSGLSGKRDEHDCAELETNNVHHMEHLVKISKQLEQFPELSESPEKKPTKSGKCNLRKSLAWDKAFFTSEGVLNTEELAIVNSTFRKAEAHALPGIQEDIRKSTESTSTLDSDSWALENLEVDLFESLRISTQKSLVKCDTKRTIEQSELHAPHSCRSKTEVSSQNKMKIPSTLRRHSVIKQRPEDTSKEALIRVKVDAIGRGESKPSLKPPRVAPRASALPTVSGKKTSAFGSVQTKSNAVNVANRQSVRASKRSGESGNVTPRSIPSPKLTSGPHLGNDAMSIGSSSDSSSKSSLENSRKRRTRNIDHPSSGTTAKTFLRSSKSKTVSTNANDTSTGLRSSKSKTGSNNANSTPTGLKTMFKLFSGASPNSSVDSVVSEASSSTSVSMIPSNSTESLDAGSSSSPSIPVPFNNGVPRPSDFNKLSTNQSCSRAGNSGAISQGQQSTGNHSRSFIDGGSKANCFKPSGLRMPTPKIGYFDASGLQNNMPKNTGINNLVGANKTKPGKLPSVRPAAQNPNMNSGSPHTRSTRLSSIHGSKPASPSTLHRQSKPAELRGSLNHELSSKVNVHLSSITSKDDLHKLFEVQEGVSDVTESSQLSNLSAEGQAHKSNFKPMTATPGNESSISGEGDSNISCKSLQVTEQIAEIETHEQSSCLSHMEEVHAENDLHSAGWNIEKESVFGPDNTAGLNGHLQTENLNLAMVKLIGRGVSSLSLSEKKELSLGGDSESSAYTSVPITPEQRCHVMQSSQKLGLLSVSPTIMNLGPSERTPLADNVHRH